MDRFVIEGGHPLRGEITASGNKNAALKMLPACLLTSEPVILRNVPDIADVRITAEIMRDLGVEITEIEPHTWQVHAREIRTSRLPEDKARQIRSSIVMAGPLLARTGSLALPVPGGDVIGVRRLDTHILVLEKLGAHIDYTSGMFTMNADGLRGANLLLDEASVTATENAILAAVTASGTTVVRNAASEPHVQNLCHMLNTMGGQIENIGSNCLTIHGVKRLHGGECRIGADYLEVGSFIGAAVMTGGEIQVDSLDYALFLKNRGYVVDPDPGVPEVQEAFKHGAIKSFARHSRLGYTDLSTPEKVRESFMKSVNYLRKLGYRRISLKTGSYGMEALAMSLKFASDAKLDLLTIDGSGGGTGMSPWNMMESWGVPSLLLHSKAYEYATIIAAKGQKVVDLAFAGGLAREDHIFKALALGAPYTKMICMGRAAMIPGFVGSNIEGVLKPQNRAKVNGNWDELAPAVKELGSSAEEIFAGYYDVQKKVGASEMKKIPFGAIAMWTLADKLAAGLQQLMAGARKFDLKDIGREDIFSANRDVEKETGIPFITDVLDERAKSILNS
jgi:hypothetical protein